MKKFWKIFLLAGAAILVMLSLSSCASSASNPDDTGGTWENIMWSYTKGDNTLTILGSGEIPDSPNSESVPWNSVRGAVKAVKFKADDGESFTSVGDYAFYGMTKLETINIPEGITEIGTCAFAFCSKLEDVSLPSTLTTLGDGAFETCVALESITLPAETVDIGESAFAFCRALKTVTVSGKPEQIKRWTFRDCTALESLRMDALDTSFDELAFEGASVDKDDIKSLHTSVVSISCKDENGDEIRVEHGVAVLEIDEEKKIDAPGIDGYEIVGDSSSTVVGSEEPITVEFIYKRIEEEDATDAAAESTEAPAATDAPEEKNKTDFTAIIAIVVFVVVIGGIAVGAFFLIRSDKKTTKDSMTVRKKENANNKKGKRK